MEGMLLLNFGICFPMCFVFVSDLPVQIGYVGQEPVLFQGTIRENIAKGEPGASFERIQGAAKAANAHDFITEFKVGKQTLILYIAHRLHHCLHFTVFSHASHPGLSIE